LRIASNDTQPGNTTPKTCAYKIEMEAPFYRARIHIFSREAAVCAGWKFLVASTEKVAHASQNERYTPMVGGVSYNSLASSSNPYGWRAGTFAGNATGSTPAAASGIRASVLTSDWVECASVPRLDGSLRHYLMVRLYNPGVAGNTNTIMRGPISGNGFATWNTAAGNAWYREWRIGAVNNLDGVGTLSNMDTNDYEVTADWPFWIGVEVDYGVPTRTFFAFGDSLTASGGGQSYDFDLWLWRSVMAASTPAAPMHAFNNGASSQTHATFSNFLKDMVSAGIRPTDVIIPIGSPNDAESIWNTNQCVNRVLDAIDQTLSIDARPFLTTRFPNDTYSGVNEAQRLAENQIAKSICAANKRVTLVDFDLATSNQASPAKWKAGLRFDDYHPNATGEQAAADALTAAILQAA
jgi:lysophospholipase L1-like esterase